VVSQFVVGGGVSPLRSVEVCIGIPGSLIASPLLGGFEEGGAVDCL
jgi:hypothetical protein